SRGVGYEAGAPQQTPRGGEAPKSLNSCVLLEVLEGQATAALREPREPRRVRSEPRRSIRRLSLSRETAPRPRFLRPSSNLFAPSRSINRASGRRDARHSRRDADD